MNNVIAYFHFTWRLIKNESVGHDKTSSKLQLHQRDFYFRSTTRSSLYCHSFYLCR